MTKVLKLPELGAIAVNLNEADVFSVVNCKSDDFTVLCKHTLVRITTEPEFARAKCVQHSLSLNVDNETI